MIYVPTIGFRNLNTDKVPQVTKIFHSELFLKERKKIPMLNFTFTLTITMPAFLML